MEMVNRATRDAISYMAWQLYTISKWKVIVYTYPELLSLYGPDLYVVIESLFGQREVLAIDLNAGGFK